MAVCMGFVRELWEGGKSTERRSTRDLVFPAILLPFSGFLLMGMAAALAKKVYLFLNRAPKVKRKEKKNDE